MQQPAWRRALLALCLLAGLLSFPADAGTSVTFNGVSYTVPAVGDASWGTAVSNYLIAISTGSLQKTGGSFTLTAETDFGATYGLKAPYFKSKTSVISSAGVLRMGTSDAVSWRNAANNADLPLIVDSGNLLKFNGNQIYTNAATASANGYLASTDWTTFNNVVNKVPSTRNVNTTAPLAGGGALSGDLTLSIPVATTTANGYLATTDWQAFNSIARVPATATVNGYLASTDWATFNTVTTRSISTTAPLAGGGTLAADRTLSITQSANNGNGYLSSTDWQAFNSVARVAGTGSVNGYLALADWTAFNSISRVAGTASVNGYIASADWTTFNNRVATTRSISTTAPLAGGGDLSANRTFTITQAGVNGNGYLSSTDWQAFNSGGNTKATSTASGYLSSTDWTTFNSLTAGSVATTRTISTTAPLTGGGDLSANRTFAITQSGTNGNGYLSSGDWQTFNNGILQATTSAFGTVKKPSGELYYTGNGACGTGAGNRIMRFTTATVATGTANITYASDSVNGDTFTVGEAGIYSVTHTALNNGGNSACGISKNASSLTVTCDSITIATRLGCNSSPGECTVSAVFHAAANDVLRAHFQDACLSTSTAQAAFRIIQLSKD